MLNPRGVGTPPDGSSLNDNGSFLLDHVGHLDAVVHGHFLVVVVVAAVNVVADHSGVGSLQGWGRDGHGRGLLLLLSGTAFHLVKLL